MSNQKKTPNNDINSSSSSSEDDDIIDQNLITPKVKLYQNFKEESSKKYKKTDVSLISTDIVKNKFINQIKNKLKSENSDKFIKYG